MKKLGDVNDNSRSFYAVTCRIPFRIRVKPAGLIFIERIRFRIR